MRRNLSGGRPRPLAGSREMQRILDNLPPTTCILDSSKIPGLAVIKFSIDHLLKTVSNYVLLIATDCHILKYAIPSVQNHRTRISFIDCFSDPCGWLDTLNRGVLEKEIDCTGLNVSRSQTNASTNFSEIFDIIRTQVNQNNSCCSSVKTQSVIVFDSITFLILLGGVQPTIRFLKRVQGLQGAKLILVVHADLHEDRVLQTLCHGAGAIFSVAAADEDMQDAMCRVDLQKARTNGSVSFKVSTRIGGIALSPL